MKMFKIIKNSIQKVVKFGCCFSFLILVLFGCQHENSQHSTVFIVDTIDNKTIVIKGLLVDGKKMGIWNEFGESPGYLESTECYLNDSLNGPYVYYRENLEILTTGEFKNNLKEGFWTTYHKYPNIVASRKSFKRGKRVGVWEDFDYKGHLELKVRYGENEKEEILLDRRLPIPDITK